MPKVSIDVPLNRVEGDLEIRVELDDGVVTDAWCSGTMYRGYERILKGRSALDGLVITPRVCGICGTAHLTAAARALEGIAGVQPPPGAIRIRNLALMTETMQSDIRHSFLMFAVDFLRPVYRDNPLYAEAVSRYQPFEGRTHVETIRRTKRLLEIVAIIGGQWPHSSYMVPGGIVSLPGTSDLMQCRHLLNGFREWYERRVLGCRLDRWLELRRAADLDDWLDEREEHRQSEIGFFVRYGREIGLDQMGRGHDAFISYGAFDLPEGTAVHGTRRQNRLVPRGFARGTRVQAFDESKVAEHVAYSWYRDYERGKHPFDGETVPYATGKEGKKYSWAKAPRYDGQPAETGPLAEMVIGGNPLFVDLVDRYGPNVLVRELARLARPAELLQAMDTWFCEATNHNDFYRPPGELLDGQGVGLIQATRGALGHWVKIAGGVIEHYQIVTPTAWHASPRDSDGVRGVTEEALVGTVVRDPTDPVELGHVVRSFDHCLVCTVHTVSKGRPLGRLVVGT